MSTLPKFHLFRRGNGVYYVQYLSEGRLRWKSTRCTTQADAHKALTQFRDLFKVKPTTKPLSVFIEEFLAHARITFRSSTVDLYNRALKLLQAVAGDVALSSLSAQHLDSYKVQRLTAKASPVTLNMEVRALKAAMNTALRWKLIECNPFQDLQQVAVPDVPPSYLTKPDFQRLLSVIGESWLRELVIFAVSTRMRQGEMLNLRWQDVDLSRKLIHIHSDGTFKTKQGKRRTIPMNEAIHAMLEAKAARSDGKLVFTRRSFPIAKNYVQHKFKFYVKEAGLDVGLHWHSLRHTHASWLVQDGVSLYEVQKLLGHSSSRVTEIYSHLQPEQMHDRVNRITLK